MGADIVGNIALKLTESIDVIEKKIRRALAREADREVKRVSGLLTNEVKPIIAKALRNSPTIQELGASGNLRGELGLTSGVGPGMANEIVDAIVSTIHVVAKKITIMGNKFAGGLNIYIQPANLRNLLELAGGSYKYYSRTYKQYVEIDWLDWLIRKGDAILVGQFKFEEAGSKGFQGRSGMGTMVRGGIWRVPPLHAGTIDDNFITRAVSDEETVSSILKLIEKNFK